MFLLGERLERENKTIKAMIEIYCKKNHKSNIGSCSECRQIYDYASYRITRCPHKDNKPACTTCEIHCFSLKMKEEIKKIMRFSGPRMLIHHPILSLFHYIDKLKEGSLKKSTS
ncbi:MAG: hypothetical protein FD167_1507 [bacterium]|nr:MAG: hypothetical protein FD167_1507 [bacterium]